MHAAVGTATLLRWKNVPEFQQAYREAKRATFEQSSARLQQASGAAVSTLLKVMLDPRTHYLHAIWQHAIWQPELTRAAAPECRARPAESPAYACSGGRIGGVT
jgi:hypothetical protein